MTTPGPRHRTGLLRRRRTGLLRRHHPPSETECAAGTYQPDFGQSSCLDADAGHYVGDRVMQTSYLRHLPARHRTDLLRRRRRGLLRRRTGPHPDRMRRRLLQPDAQTSCDDADAGYYVGTTASHPRPPAQTYQPDTAQTSCDDADAGYYVGAAAMLWTACAASTYSPTRPRHPATTPTPATTSVRRPVIPDRLRRGPTSLTSTNPRAGC